MYICHINRFSIVLSCIKTLGFVGKKNLLNIKTATQGCIGILVGGARGACVFANLIVTLAVNFLEDEIYRLFCEARPFLEARDISPPP